MDSKIFSSRSLLQLYHISIEVVQQRRGLQMGKSGRDWGLPAFG